MERWILLSILCGTLLHAAEPRLQPVTVCEVLQDLAAYDGKVVAIVGRFSFRQSGRWLGEQKCAKKLVTGDQEWPNAFWIAYEPSTAPKPPAVLTVDAALLAQKLREVKLATSLSRLRFGSTDYDNWALVYGRVETRKDLLLTTPGGTRKNGFGVGNSSPARLVCHGEAEIVFLNE
ncbi:MAG TPA: hypothetical protein VKR61_00460 [Bryobacteraceae bacterium]|nr:hypothetical protein [Bryobacteraceae bacterium]